MKEQPETIEVEVVEIDGVAPVPPARPEPEEQSSRQTWNDWQGWQGKVRQLDMRWWPLWVVLGAILLFLVLTVGLFLGIIWLIFRFIAGVLSALLSPFRR